MRLLITGDSTVTEYRLLATLLDWSRLSDEATRVVSGTNPGVDRLAKRWAEERWLDVDLFNHASFVKRHGRTLAATRQRFADMDAVSDAGVILWDGRDRPMWDLIQLMRSTGKPVDVGRIVDGKVQTELV